MSTINMNDITFHISINELIHSQGISQEIILEMIEYEIVEPLSPEPKSELNFDIENIFWIKKAAQLKRELEVDWAATSVIIKLLKKKEQLEKENQSLKARLNR